MTKEGKGANDVSGRICGLRCVRSHEVQHTGNKDDPETSKRPQNHEGERENMFVILLANVFQKRAGALTHNHKRGRREDERRETCLDFCREKFDNRKAEGAWPNPVAKGDRFGKRGRPG